MKIELFVETKTKFTSVYSKGSRKKQLYIPQFAGGRPSHGTAV
jgi:hypothetical protein